MVHWTYRNIAYWNVIETSRIWWSFMYIVETSRVISRWVLVCDSAHSWRLYSAVPLGDQAVSTRIQYPTLWDYSDAELSSACSVLPSTGLGSDKNNLCKSLAWLSGVFMLLPLWRRTTVNTLCLFVVVLHPSNIDGYIRTGFDLW